LFLTLIQPAILNKLFWTDWSVSNNLDTKLVKNIFYKFLIGIYQRVMGVRAIQKAASLKVRVSLSKLKEKTVLLVKGVGGQSKVKKVKSGCIKGSEQQFFLPEP